MRKWLRAVRALNWRGWLVVLAFLVGFPVALMVLALFVLRVGLVVPVLTLFGALGTLYLLGLLRETWRNGRAVQRERKARRDDCEARRAARRRSRE